MIGGPVLAGHRDRRYGLRHAQRPRYDAPPAGNPGFLPGMNAGTSNLGASPGFLVLPAVLVATPALAHTKASCLTEVTT